MRVLKFLLGLVAVGMIFPQLLSAQTPAAPKRLTSVEGITEYELANGMHVLLFPDPSQPKITVNVTYKVGSRVEGYGETGMAHLLEHMVFKGSTHHPNIPQELTNHGASPNGSTWYDRTNYFETFSATDENLNWALDMESDRMVNSFIANKDLQSEFSVVRNEFESGENSPSGVLMERILSTMYLWHNYGKSTIGSKEDIEKVPIQNLMAFYKKYYQPDNAVLVVAGKIDEAKTLALVNKYFGGIPRPTRVLQPAYTVEPTQDGERFVELRRVGDVQTIACAYHIPAGTHPDFAAIDVLNEIMTNEPNGRIYQAMVKSGKASSVWSWAAGLHDPGFIYINADVLKEKSLDDAKNTLFATLDELKTKPITADELDKAKNKLIRDFETTYRSTTSIGLAMSEFIGSGDWRLGFIYRDRLKAVTVADVNRVAATYIKNSNRTYGTFIPTPSPVRAIIPETPNVDSLVNGYKGNAPMAAGEAFDPTPANIDTRSEHGTMMGGAKYTLLSKTTRGETVEARFTLRLGDELSLQNKATLAQLTAAMLERGTRSRTMAQIHDELDRLSSSINIGADGQNVSISVTSTKPNLLATLDILDDMLHQPAFAADEFKTLIDQTLSGLDEERSDPNGIASREFQRILNPYPAGDIRHAMSLDEEVAAVKAVTLDQVKQFHADYYNGSSATAAFVGDFDKDAVKTKLGKMLGNWSAVKSYAHVPSPFQTVTSQNQEFKTPDKKNAMFLTGTNLKMRDDNPDYPAMMMANFIFGGGFLNSRLATRIRQHDGISYGVGSFLQVDNEDETGVFGAYAIYNPDNKAKLEAAYKEELQRAITGGFTQEELDQAKTGLLQYRQTSRANDGQLSGLLNGMAYLNRNMSFSQHIDDQLQALTLAQVNAAFKKYIDPNNFSYVKAGDFK